MTCSLDKTVKFWTVPELGGSSDSSMVYHSSLPALSSPSYTISTHYPVWRARNLPFGRGVLALPQRGEKALEMFGMDDDAPVERFQGHENVVKDFVWRMRGGNDSSFDDREFQLVTWSKDRTLRIWPVSRELEERVGWQYGAPIKALVSRRGAPDVTYTKDPFNTDIDAPRLPPPVVNHHPANPSNLTRQRSARPEAQPGMTRGGNKVRRMDQLEWLTKVVKNAPSPESSLMSSRIASVSRTRRPASRAASRLDSRSASAEDRQEWKNLKDEVVAVSRIYPRPKINFEKIDLAHRKLTISMQGPWANGDRQAFMRIHWSFPPNYPYGPEIPTFELERNPTVSPITRQTIVMNIKEMRAHNKQCLIETTGYLLGLHERQGRRRGMDEESDSESSVKGEEKRREDVVPELMLRKTCGATFGPNGQLVCFFPKQVTLPRTRNFSRSPSVTRENPSPMLKAISALTRLQNPHQRAVLRYKPRTRRLDPISSPLPPPAGSTMTIHDVSYLGQPNIHLAKMYGMSVEANMSYALEAKRLDHADVWATVRGILADPPPPYTQLPQLDEKQDRVRRERLIWEKGMERKKKVVDRLFTNLMAQRDVQMLALLSCILLEYTRSMYIPPVAESVTSHSPMQDYFNLRFVPPRPTLNISPVRRRTGSSVIPVSPTNSSSFRTSGWSQILNPSGISLRGALTPKEHTSFSDIPFSRTALSTSYEEQSSPNGLAVAIPTSKRSDSPKPIQGDKSKVFPTSSMSPPPIVTPLRSSGPEKSLYSGGEPRSHKVSFGSASPITRGGRSQSSIGYVGAGGLGSAVTTGPNTPDGERKAAVRDGGVKLDFPKDESSTPSLLPQDMLPLCEAWKLSYADFLLRHHLLGVRMTLLSYRFITSSTSTAVDAASGKSSGIVRAGVGETEKMDEGQSVIRVCVPCSGTPSGTCPSCNKQPQKAVCSYCRVPIKGISMGCTICAHKFHAKCFQRYFLSPVTTPMTCPACSCSCLAHRGISTPLYTVAALPKQSPNITRGGFDRGKMPSENAPLARSRSVPSQGRRGRNSPEEGKSRLTYASLVKLGAIRENFGLGFADGGSSGTASAMGFHADGDGDEVSTDRDKTVREHRGDHRGDGLLARARWGGEGLLHWGSTTHHQ